MSHRDGSYRDGPKPRVMGHRGSAGTAPENTIASFHAAIAAGADVLELDVHATSDGQIVVLHDPTVDRTTDGTGDVKAMTFEALRKLDAGARFVPAPGATAVAFEAPLRVPTLEEVLTAFPTARFNIEIKQAEPAIEREVLAVIDRHQARSRVLLAAEEVELATRIRALGDGSTGSGPGEFLTGMAAQEVMQFLLEGDSPGYRPPGFALQVPPTFGEMPIITKESVARAHAVGLEVHAWTIDDEEEMRMLLALGVDGLITNVPERAVRLLGRA